MKKKIKILHLIEHLDVGGAERAAVDIIKSLDPEKIDSLCCVYRHIGAFGHELKDLKFPVFFLKKSFVSDKLINLSGNLSFIVKLLLLPLIFLESIVFITRLIILIKKNRIDIVHSHLYSANFWGRLTVALSGHKPDIITTEHNTSNYNHSWKVNFSNRLLSRASTRIVAVSKTVAESLLEVGWANREQLHVIPNGILLPEDRLEINASDKNDSPLLPGKGLRIAIIAYLWPVKRHDLFFKAVQICLEQGKEFTCLVIGDGPERDRLEALVSNSGLRKSVKFLGERYDVLLLLKQIDIVVSTSDTEGLPVNLLEALSEGIAVVATKAGGTADIIKDNETGILVEKGNAEAIADGICKMIDNRVLAGKLGENGKKLVYQSYSMKNIARQWQELYEEVFYKDNRI